MNLNFSFSAFYMTAYWTRKFCENYCSMAAAKFVKFNCLDWSPVNECEKNIHLTFTFKRFFRMNCSWTVSCKKCASGRSLCWQWRRRRAHLWSLVSPCVPSVGWPITRHRATVNGGDSPQTRERERGSFLDLGPLSDGGPSWRVHFTTGKYSLLPHMASHSNSQPVLPSSVPVYPNERLDNCPVGCASSKARGHPLGESLSLWGLLKMHLILHSI